MLDAPTGARPDPMKTMLVLAAAALVLAACAHDRTAPPQYGFPRTTSGGISTEPNQSSPSTQYGIDPAATRSELANPTPPASPGVSDYSSGTQESPLDTVDGG
jgi:hypothetical protein